MLHLSLTDVESTLGPLLTKQGSFYTQLKKNLTAGKLIFIFDQNSSFLSFIPKAYSFPVQVKQKNPLYLSKLVEKRKI